MGTLVRRFISVALSVLLGFTFMGAYPQASAAETPSGNPDQGNEWTSPAAISIPSQFQVTLYNRNNPSQTTLATMLPIQFNQREGIPTWEGFSFVRAWLKSPEAPGKQLEITGITFQEAGPGNYMPNNEPYIMVSLAHVDYSQGNQPILAIPQSQTAQYIYLEYLPSGRGIDVSYLPQATAADIKVAGPTRIYTQPNGSAQVIFSVSTKRNFRPTQPVLSGLDNGELSNVSVKKIADISTPDRTVFRYELNVASNFSAKEPLIQVALSAEEKTKLNISFSPYIGEPLNSGHYPDDWRLGSGVGKYGSQIFGNPSSTTFNYGGEVHFNIYCDRAPEQKYFAYSSMLAALHLNGQSFAPAQPFLRYGLAAYRFDQFGYTPNTMKNWVWLNGTGKNLQNLYPPFYGFDRSNWVWERMLACPYLVQGFCNIQQWDLYNLGSFNAKDHGYLNWYYTQIYSKILESSRQGTGPFSRSIFVESGPLAGSIVDIDIQDILPSVFSNYQLGSGEIPYTNAAPGVTTGDGNCLRMMYRVTIRNITENIQANTEWALTSNVKVGVYENLGVEDVQAQCTKVGWQDAFNTYAQDQLPWNNVPNKNGEGYIDIRSLSGAKEATYTYNTYWMIQPYTVKFAYTPGRNPDNPHGAPAGPILKLRGNVMNGYHAPRPVAPNRLFPDIMRDPALNTSNPSGGYGFEARFDVPAAGANNNEDGVSVAFGGMSTVGVRANLMKVTAKFDLSGGSLPKEVAGQFPLVGSNNGPTHDVVSNPIVHIPNGRPEKTVEGLKTYSTSWRLYYKNARTGQLVDTGKVYFPQESFDIRNLDNVATRLSDTSGNIITNEFVLKAQFEDKLGEDPLIYRAEELLYAQSPSINASAKPVKTEFMQPFWGMQGVWALPIMPPSTIDYNNDTYVLENGAALQTMVKLGPSSQPAYTGIYHKMTMADKWRIDHGEVASGEIQCLPWGSNVTREVILGLINNGQYIDDQVKINLNPPINTWVSTSLATSVVTLTFPDGSTLQGEIAYCVGPMSITGLSQSPIFPWFAACAAAGAVGLALVLGWWLQRRRKACTS